MHRRHAAVREGAARASLSRSRYDKPVFLALRLELKKLPRRYGSRQLAHGDVDRVDVSRQTCGKRWWRRTL
jgi:hypothetical protein